MSKLMRDGLTIWAFDVLDEHGTPGELEIRAADGAVYWTAPTSWTASCEVLAQIEAAANEAEELAREQRGS